MYQLLGNDPLNKVSGKDDGCYWFYHFLTTNHSDLVITLFFYFQVFQAETIWRVVPCTLFSNWSKGVLLIEYIRGPKVIRAVYLILMTPSISDTSVSLIVSHRCSDISHLERMTNKTIMYI